jgi:signal transduction histidine kinase
LDLLGLLQWIQALLFLALGLLGLRAYRRQRSRPAAYVAGAFGILAAVITASRLLALLGETAGTGVLRDLIVAGLLAFPWLLAAFVWSFEGPLPRWLRVTGVGVVGFALLLVPLPPIGGVEDPGRAETLYLVVMLLGWALLIGVSAVHLWRVGRAQRIVRARTRLLASGGLVLALALLLAGAGSRVEVRGFAVSVAVLTIVAALLFSAGVAPPALLRWYWRQLPAQRMHQMQTALVAAATPDQVAAAVTPVIGDTFGAGALCVDPTGHIVARHALPADEADRVAAETAGGAELPDHVRATSVDGWWLVVRTSPYAPLLGDDELALLDRFALQFRIALQRAELFAALERGREELERSSADVQAMLVGLAHDLRSPAVTISTYASLLRDADDPRDRDQMVDGINDSSAYLDRLVHGLLELSRIGRSDGEPEPVDLGGVVGGVARRLAASYPGATVEVTTPLPTVHVDRLRAEQVVDNLLGNAAKHGGRPDLTVRVSWAPSSTGGQLTIEDDGVGVPEAEREQVFALFRRGSSTQAAGSGVGLGLVRRIVEAYGGRIRIAPSQVGTRVEIELPRERLVATDGSAPLPASTSGATGGEDPGHPAATAQPERSNR